MTTAFHGTFGVMTYRAVAVQHALRFYAKTGCKVNTLYTPKNMMRVASEITGQEFKPRDYQRAINALGEWILNNGTAGE
jgi:hypothetical protein